MKKEMKKERIKTIKTKKAKKKKIKKTNNSYNAQSKQRNSKQLSIRQTLLSATDGLIGATTNLVLYVFFLSTSLVGATTHYKIYESFTETDELMQKINYKSIKKAIYNLTYQGLITKKQKNNHVALSISKQGLKRAMSLIPIYDEKRIWDNSLYLISYDVPTKANKARDRLRVFLKHIGCGLLQESLWMTPYNPKSLINNFITEHKIKGTILISNLGKSGAIGDEDLSDLLNRVYKLNELQKRYEKFIEQFSHSKSTISPFTASIKFHAILKDDPQLPFELLPKHFPCNKAYRLYKKYCP